MKTKKITIESPDSDGVVDLYLSLKEAIEDMKERNPRYSFDIKIEGNDVVIKYVDLKEHAN